MPTRLINIHSGEPYDINIGRAPRGADWDKYPWHNPYSHLHESQARFKVRTRQDAIEAFPKYLRTQPQLWNFSALSALAGKTLGCWCVPLTCHGVYLCYLADLSLKTCSRCGVNELEHVLRPKDFDHEIIVPGAPAQEDLFL